MEYSGRQPVHTVYGGAHLFKAGIARKLGEIALQHFKKVAPDASALFETLGVTADASFKAEIYGRIENKLKAEAVEDFRVDFEDGYGNRSDIEEDADAELVAKETATGMGSQSLPPFFGIRIKGLSDESRKRALRTLEVFCTHLKRATKVMPENFIITLPKVTNAGEVKTLVSALKRLEQKHKWKKNCFKIELMVETPQAIFDLQGRLALPTWVKASAGRCTAVHFGTYDYTSALGIVSSHQRMNHPDCEFAKNIMKVGLAGSGVFLSDGATTLLPIPPVVKEAWRLSYSNIRHSLSTGFYQGWDLHPAQIPVRYAATYIFFLENLDVMARRLKGFIESAARARLTGGHFDDAATAHGLSNFFSLGLSCGALNEADVMGRGLSLEQISSDFGRV